MRTALRSLLVLACLAGDGVLLAENLLIDSPTDGACVPLLREGHRRFLSKSPDAREAQLADKAAHKGMVATGWWPEPVRVAWHTTDRTGRSATVSVRRVHDGEVVFQAMTTNAFLDVFNLEIARAYDVRVAADGLAASVRFRTEDRAPRYLKVPCVDNFRDLGGRIGQDGRRVRQGLVYRSAKLNGFARVLTRCTREEAIELYRTGGLEGRGTEAMLLKGRLDRGETDIPDVAFAIPKDRAPGPETLTEAAKAFLTDTLGVKTDLDLRDRFGCWGLTASPVGRSVRWVHSSQAFYGEMATDWGKRAFAEAFRVFLDKANYPILFHCTGGADRTGGLALILNGLLGVCEDELVKDWEMTGFYIFTLNGGQADFTHKARLGKLLEVFSRYPGGTINERICGYVRDCGLADADIRRFREILLEERVEE